jgi:hypothetical protein
LAGTKVKAMTMRLGPILLSVLFSSAVISCQKTMEVPEMDANDGSRVRMLASQKSFSYGETTFYVGKNQRENLISPVVKPNEPGKFVAIPAGLYLNSTNGTIDLSKSDAGQAYKIFFVSANGKLADSARIVISGVDYTDGVYNLKSSQPNAGKLTPKYNANAAQFVPVSVTNSFGEDNKGQTKGRLKINSRTGEIDLEASINNGAFGRANPGNGASSEFNIQYRIADRSSRTPNSIKMKLYYFSSESAVPQDLLNTIKEREEIMKRVNAMPVGNTSEAFSNGGTESDLDAFAKPVRPPLIVVIN